MYFYDVAFRIGANRKLLPKNVYLHAGTRNGAKMLSNAGLVNPPIYGKLEYIEKKHLPKCLQKFAPWEIENVLCHFYNQHSE